MYEDLDDIDVVDLTARILETSSYEIFCSARRFTGQHLYKSHVEIFYKDFIQFGQVPNQVREHAVNILTGKKAFIGEGIAVLIA